MTDIQGKCEGAFKEVREVFARNFTERGEVGASVCVTVGGKVVVDLHGGIADPATGKPWSPDTIGIVWSSTKGAAALCAHILVDRGLLDLDAPVAAYWPEFAHAGKERIPVRMLLTHQAGVPALRKPVPPGGFYDWRGIVDALAAEAPFWEPGTRHGYHALVFGFLVGEVVRRVTGRSLGTFFQEEVARPLGLDFWIGLPASEEHRVAPYIPADPPTRLEDMSAFFRAIVADPTSLQGLVAGNTGGFFESSGYNTREAHAAEIPAANGITNARGLAGMYAPLALGGAMGGARLVSEETVAAMGAVQSAAAVDAVILGGTRFSLGFMKTVDNRKTGLAGDSVLLSEEAFGHAGMGGSIGFADPGAGMSFGYVMNKQGPGIGLNERGQALVDATYRALGYEAPRGIWRKRSRHSAA